jgi:PAS domain S-box-containing protein
MFADRYNLADESFRILAETIPQMVYVYDAHGKLEYLNGRFLSYTGLPAVGGGVEDWEIVHPDDRMPVRIAWEKALVNGESFSLETRIRCAADGSYRWHLSRAVRVRSDAGIGRWYGTLTDIDDQKRTEETLRLLADVSNRFSATLSVTETLQRLADTAIEVLADWCGIYVYDGGELRTAAYAHKDPQKLALAQALTREYPMREHDAAAIVARTGEPSLIAQIDDDMLRALAVDDRHYELTSRLGLRSAMVLPLRARGELLGSISLVSAESSHTFTEADLRLAQALAQRAALAYDNARILEQTVHSEEQMRMLVETIPQLVWISSGADGAIEYVNARWTEYFGTDSERSRTWLLRQYVHPDDFERANARWKHSLQTGDAYEIEYRLRRYDGSYHWFLARCMPVRNRQGTIVQWFGSATDIDAQQLEYERTQRVADTLQDAFIPRTLPQTAAVTFDATYVPAENEARVGGDWYDAFVLDDGTIVFSIGDITGHGLEAAIAMGNIRQAILGASIDTPDPAAVLQKVNRIICSRQSSMASAIVGFVREGRVTYCSAGHPPPILATTQGSRILPYGGLLLGADTQSSYHTHGFAFGTGDALLLYTDGLTEAGRDVEAAERELLAAASRAAATPSMTAADIRRAVLGDAGSNDDTAVMLLRFR